jgi:hypothetical protein
VKSQLQNFRFLNTFREKPMKAINTRFCVAVVSASLAISASSASAAPVTNWTVDTASGAIATVVYSNLATDSPVIGDGTANNANSGIITSNFPTISLLNGESIILSGSMTIAGAKTTGEDVGFQFGVLYEPGTAENPADTAGWLGYKADNANAGQVGGGARGSLRARTTTGTNFTTTTWISSAGGRDTAIATVSNTILENGVFSSGTYDFGITVKRQGADVIVSASILGTGSTVFTNVFGPVTVTDPVQKTFDFNRVGFWSVTPLDADQVSFNGIDVSVVPAPVPGDFDSDGDVDGADFIVWQTNFPITSGATPSQGDADGDTDVDGADFATWQSSFPAGPGLGVSPVPEPAGLSLLAFAGVVGCVRLLRQGFNA